MKQLDYVLNNDKEVLAFLKSQYPMYHLSNVFFRDVQYGIQKLFERRGEKIGYNDAEKIARSFAGKLEKDNIFKRIDGQSWVLHYPEYKKPVAAPAAKPAPGAAPAKSPAAGGARPALPPLGSAKPAGAAPASKPALPPLSSAKPAAAAKPALPPLSSAKPAGGKPALPPLSSSKPTGASSEPAKQESAPEQKAAPQPATGQDVATAPAKESKQAAPSQVSPASGEKKSLPPLKGNYKPAGK